MASSGLGLSRVEGVPAIGRDALIQYGLAVLALLLVLAPLVPILYQSLLDRPLYDEGGRLTLQNYANLFAHPSFGRVVANSLVFAAITTGIAVVLGVATAVLVGRTDVPGRRLLGQVLVWPLYVSHLVLAFGWFIMYGPAGYVTMLVSGLAGEAPWNLYSIPGMAVVAGLSEAPLVHLYCLASATSIDASLEDAARTVGAGPFRTLSAVTVPLMRPAILYSLILSVTVALEMLAIPLVFGGPVGIEFFTTFLYNQGLSASQPDYGLVGTAATLLLVIVTLLVLLQRRLLGNGGRFVTVGGKASRPRLFRLGWLRWPFFALLLLYVAFGVVAPIAGLALRAVTSFLTPFIPPWELLTLANVKMVFAYPAYVRSIVNTVLIALVGGAVATAFVAMVALVAQRSEFRYRGPLEFVALYPRAVPGLIAGLGFFWGIAAIPMLGWLRNTLVILALAYTMRYLPTGFGAVAPMLVQIAPDLDRSARTVGADWWTTCRHILIKLLKPALASSFAVLFVHFFKEYVTAVFLFAPGSEVIGTTLLQFWIQGDTGPVAALSVIQIAITVVFVYASRRILGIRIYA
ncbi:MAG TPA: iron ABC transporter permease [Thermodesulfobacteriota bacterium]